MTPIAPPSVVNRFCDLWVESFSRSLGALGVLSPSAGASDPIPVQAPSSEEMDKLVCTRFLCAGALEGELLWVAEKSAAISLSQIQKREMQNPDAEFSDAQRTVFAELLQQIASGVAAAWKTEFSSEIELTYQATVESAPVTAQSVTLKINGDKLLETSLRLFLNEELSAALSALQLPAPTSEPTTAASATSSPVSSQSAPPATPPRSSPLPVNLGLVLDVELEATIRFGEREMLLREIFGLMAGAVVELEQMVNEPAELLVAGRLVARGEVVVVDGNFGLRVTEVASVNERVAAIQLGREG